MLARFVDGGPPGCRNTREAANVAGASGLRQAVIKKSPRYPDRAAIIIRRENTFRGGRERPPFYLAKQTISMADSGRFPS